MNRPARWWVFVPLGQLLLAGLFAWSGSIPAGGHQSTTLLAFPPGAKNPNTCLDVREYGFPVPWLRVTHITNEARDLDGTVYTVGSPLIPLSAVLIAVCFPLAIGASALPPRPRRTWGNRCWLLSGGAAGVLAIVFVLAHSRGTRPVLSTADLLVGTERFQCDALFTLATAVGFVAGAVFARAQLSWRPAALPSPAPDTSPAPGTAPPAAGAPREAARLGL